MPTRPFSLLIKPASADCNLRCKYCFYLDHCSLYPEAAKHRMTDEVLEQMVRTYMQTEQPQYSFGWQGGEPTLMGADFFRRAVQFQQKYGASGAMVGNGLQTNGTLINDDLAKVLSKYSFLVGVSVDGPAEIHDHYRKTMSGGESHAAVMRGIRTLREHEVEFNILCLVSKSNVAKPADIYHYFCDNRFLFHQYISCVEPDENRNVLPFSIEPEEWGNFLCTIFDLWYENDTRRVSIRLFDSILTLMVEGARNICHFGTNCCQYFVVEHNGDIYPCDFFVEKRLHLGNVMHDSWTKLQQSPMYLDFGSKKQQWNSACNDCEFLAVCMGDCLKHRLCAGGGDPRRLSHLCAGLKQFYRHTLPRFETLARELIQERQRAMMAHPPAMAPGPVGRNDPCPCGSGRKYKKCCGRT